MYSIIVILKASIQNAIKKTMYSIIVIPKSSIQNVI